MTPLNDLHLTVITGLSGAGKSQAVATFEDMGFFCIDNLPPKMLAGVSELFSLEGSRVDRLAVVFDVRGAQYFDELVEVLDDLAERGAHCRILFLEASDEALVARYQSTRRPHPVAHEGPLLAGIQEERRLLMPLRDRADVVVDTTELNVHELRRRLQETLFADELRNGILVTFLSFGFKFGLPTEADMVFDVRFLPNPHWVAELRPLTGLDEEVRDFVVARPESHGFMSGRCPCSAILCLSTWPSRRRSWWWLSAARRPPPLGGSRRGSSRLSGQGPSGADGRASQGRRAFGVRREDDGRGSCNP